MAGPAQPPPGGIGSRAAGERAGLMQLHLGTALTMTAATGLLQPRRLNNPIRPQDFGTSGKHLPADLHGQEQKHITRAETEGPG